MAGAEDIQAKLAAYIDGELEEADRLQIEQYLESEPQQRQLVEELIRQRQLLRDLPRQPAPSDLAETISAQIERAALLSDIDREVEATTAIRIGRWGQLRAIAAVLFLTAGLAVVIYALLPSPGSNPPQIADIRIVPASSETESTITVEEPLAGKSAGQAPLASADEQPGHNIAKLGKAGQFGHEPQQVVTNVGDAGQQLFRQVVSDQIRPSEQAPGAQIVVVVRSADPQDTNRRIIQYLNSNRFNWQTVSEPMPQSLGLEPDQTIAAAKMQRTQVHLKQEYPSQDSGPMLHAQLQDRLDINAANLIVARQVSRKKADELSQALSNLQTADMSKQPLESQRGGTVLMEQIAQQPIPATQPWGGAIPASEPPAFAAATTTRPTTMPSPRRIRAGDAINIEVQQLVGPGFEPQSTHLIGADGNLTLPMLEPFSVLSLTEQELEQEIARKYREANLIPNAAVKVTILPSTPSTSTSAEAATQPAEELVDVLIVVRPEMPVQTYEAQTPATTPATQTVEPGTIAPAQ